jgi:SAM-dependent methyltransferase
MTAQSLPVPAPSADSLHGDVRELIGRLGARAVLCDPYDPVGAPIYHALSRSDTHEVREIISLLRGLPGPVLDLAAGSGRLTLPLLAAGRHVTALDLSVSMLRLLAQRLAAAPRRLRERCTVVHGDMTDFSLHDRFGAVVLGTTSISLLDGDGREGLYRAVHRHLLPGGRFLLSTLYRDDVSASGTPVEVSVSALAAGVAHRIYQRWDPSTGVRTVAVVPHEQADARVPVCVSTVRDLPASVLCRELTAAGFGVLARHDLGSGRQRERVELLETQVRA